MMKNRQPDGCREVLKLKIAIVTGKADRPSEKSAGTGKDPGQDLRRGYAERLYF